MKKKETVTHKWHTNLSSSRWEHQIGQEWLSATWMGPEGLGHDTAPYQIQLTQNSHLDWSQAQVRWALDLLCTVLRQLLHISTSPHPCHLHPPRSRVLWEGSRQNTTQAPSQNTQPCPTAPLGFTAGRDTPVEGDFWRSTHCPLQQVILPHGRHKKEEDREESLVDISPAFWWEKFHVGFCCPNINSPFARKGSHQAALPHIQTIPASPPHLAQSCFLLTNVNAFKIVSSDPRFSTQILPFLSPSQF